MFDTIERLKAEWTDKYVVINSSAPELARFAKTTGFVKTVNMNGRCLVEFDQYNNIGWYDIDPSALKIVPQPLPKPAEPKAAKPAAKEAAKPAAAKPAAGAAKKPSTADILAAARAKAGGAPAAKPATGAKLSTADILARARGAKAAAPAAAPAPDLTTEPVAEPAAEESQAPVAKAAPKAKAGGALPTTTADKIAWCRANDAKG
ncbi:MAG: hypothetical protein WCC69_07930 [Pirellulales bacterium]